jgi:isopenicillin N synthase-like dioxygenase
VKTHDDIFKGKNATKMRTLFYPPLRDEQLGEDVVRCGAHSDYGTITFLYQVSIVKISFA